jgi:hypothetical protein
MAIAPRITLAIFTSALLLLSVDARANSLLISPNPNPGQRFPVQGDCARNGINPSEPHIDLTRSTWSCTGGSGQMMRIFYREGPQDCVYIDNTNNDNGENRAFFIPLQSSDEWLAFKANLPGGVRLRYGCMGQVVKDSCGNEYALPDAPASDDPKDVVKINVGKYEVEYTCPFTVTDKVSGENKTLTHIGGCGTWQKVKESGACSVVNTPAPTTPPDVIPVPTTPGVAPPTAPTGGETTTILPTTPIDNPSGPVFQLPNN